MEGATSEVPVLPPTEQPAELAGLRTRGPLETDTVDISFRDSYNQRWLRDVTGVLWEDPDGHMRARVDLLARAGEWKPVARGRSTFRGAGVKMLIGRLRPRRLRHRTTLSKELPIARVTT